MKSTLLVVLVLVGFSVLASFMMGAKKTEPVKLEAPAPVVQAVPYIPASGEFADGVKLYRLSKDGKMTYVCLARAGVQYKLGSGYFFDVKDNAKWLRPQ